ncbi:MAG: NAD-dependent protein deacylase [Oscillospiraceae bacterium]|nr:NAD-dependent protein deacylase [Oscillospiraceae bacterium]
MNNEYTSLKEYIDNANNIVFFGGAGVSTESGIPDFRSTDGLYSMKFKYPPETMVSHSFFITHPQEFYEFYKEKLIYPDALPNKAHIALAELEKQGKLRAIITQNVDNLHQMAGSINVLELHGSGMRYYCMECGENYGLDAIMEAQDIPYCTCGGIIRPDVVLYEESLDQSILEKSVSAIAEADVLIVGGTSLNVYPAAGLLRYYNGDKLVLINKTETSYDNHASIIIRNPIGEALGTIVLGE